MIDPAAWQAFGGTAAVVILLGGVALALQRLGILRPRPAPAAPAGGDPAARVAALEKAVTDLRLHVAENYVQRGDWVEAQSRTIGMLEAHGIMLARLEERIRSRQP